MTQITNTQTDNQITEADTHQNQCGENKTMKDCIEAIHTVKHFVGAIQLEVMGDACRGEERQFFKNKFVELATTMKAMPKTYETDGQGQEAVAHLHYFHSAGFDWYITERDMEDEQLQAFGLCNLHEKELGYINIEEITKAGAELDLYWIPKALKDIK